MIGVYGIEHVASGRWYVGKSTNMGKRLSKHLSGQSGCPHLNHAIKKYGWNAFRVEILEVCGSDAEAMAREIFWIAHKRCRSPDGFNLTDGGEGASGAVCSAETRAKLSSARRGKPGKTPGAETRAKLSAAMKGKPGKPKSAETRAKMSAANIGKTLSAETRAKMSAARRGKPRSAETRAKISAAKAALTPEQRSERMRKHWITRRESRR
jgi:group I intron endonuclease